MKPLNANRLKAGLLWWVLAVILLLPAHAQVAVPALKTRVTDLTRSLTPNQLDTLEQLLKSFETRKGSQIAVLIVPSTEPEEIEPYAIRVAEAWKLGRKGIDDGVLMLIAKDDRELRIEVGRGLEGAIPDAVANRIIDEIMVPFLKQGDLYGGIQAGIVRLIRIIEGEPLPPRQAKDPSWSGVMDYLPVIFIMVFVVAGVVRAIFGRLLGAGLTAGISGFVFWLIAGTLLARWRLPSSPSWSCLPVAAGLGSVAGAMAVDSGVVDWVAAAADSAVVVAVSVAEAHPDDGKYPNQNSAAYPHPRMACASGVSAACVAVHCRGYTGMRNPPPR